MHVEPTESGLGDLVAHAFATVGITVERAQAVANAVGLDDCGCGRRREALNDLGRRYLGVGRPADTAAP